MRVVNNLWNLPVSGFDKDFTISGDPLQKKSKGCCCSTPIRLHKTPILCKAELNVNWRTIPTSTFCF